MKGFLQGLLAILALITILYVLDYPDDGANCQTANDGEVFCFDAP